MPPCAASSNTARRCRGPSIGAPISDPASPTDRPGRSEAPLPPNAALCRFRSQVLIWTPTLLALRPPVQNLKSTIMKTPIEIEHETIEQTENLVAAHFHRCRLPSAVARPLVPVPPCAAKCRLVPQNFPIAQDTTGVSPCRLAVSDRPSPIGNLAPYAAMCRLLQQPAIKAAQVCNLPCLALFHIDSLAT